MGMAKNSNNQGIGKCSNGRHKDSGGVGGAIQGNNADTPPQLSKAERIWQVIASVPEGQVVSYGQVAQLAGLPGYARFVGSTLSKLPQGSTLPWHRVVNASLEIAPRNSGRMREQKRRLRDEGVMFKGQRVAKAFHWTA